MRSLSAPGHFLILSAEQNLSLSFVQFVSQGLQFPQLLHPCFLAAREKKIKFYGLPKGTIREEAFIRCYLQDIGTTASREGSPRNSRWGCVARLSKYSPYFRPKHGIFHIRFQTWPLKSTLIFRPGLPGILLLLLRLERKIKLEFLFSYSLFLSHLELKLRIVGSYTPVVPWNTTTDSRPK